MTPGLWCLQYQLKLNEGENMRALTMNEVNEVSGGDFSIADAAATGGAIGSFGGAIIGYVGRGTLTAAAVGAAGFGSIFAAVGVAGYLGWQVGTGINSLINSAVYGGGSGGGGSSFDTPIVMFK